MYSIKKYPLLTLLLLTLLLPLSLYGQVNDQATLSGERFIVQADEEDLRGREVHITPFLLESEEGRRALETYRELHREGYFDLRPRALASQIGDRREFFVRNLDESTDFDVVFDEVEFELVRVGMDVEIWVEVDELGVDRISEEVLDTMMEGLIDRTPANSVDPDKGVVEIVRELFGEQPNVDGSGVLKVLISDIQDGWDPDESPFFTAGFFDPVNLVPPEENENSNFADIININSRPGIYREEGEVVSTRLSTMAHELQHLIHANADYGNLILFQNEGQSELAEILTGFSARGMSFLDNPEEISGRAAGGMGWVYRFRRTDSDVVLYDYQRAQLIHSYLEERSSPEDAGSVTRSGPAAGNNPDRAYTQVLDPLGIPLDQFLTDFYITAYTNGQAEGLNPWQFTRPQLSAVQVSNPGVIYDQTQQTWVLDQEERIHYGGAHYTQWFGVDQLDLEVESSDGISQTILYRMLGDSEFRHMDAGAGSFRLDEEGIYEEIVLVSVNTTPGGSVPNPGDSRTFSYSGEWKVTDLVLEQLTYHTDPFFFFPIPDDDVIAMASRFSSDFDSNVRNVRININNRESSILGEGIYRLSLREAEPRQNLWIPGAEIASRTVNIRDFSVGSNFIPVNSTEWAVEEDEEYFIMLEVLEDQGNLYLELLLDEGTDPEDIDDNDPRYSPLRTLVGIEEGGQLAAWGSFPDNNNWVVGVTLVGFKELDRDPTEPPIADVFKLYNSYPNPFSREMTLQYNVPEPATVKISVHDVLGRKVAELLDGQVQPGLWSLSFDAERLGLASGVYIFRMESPDGVDNRQVTLIR